MRSMVEGAVGTHYAGTTAPSVSRKAAATSP